MIHSHAACIYNIYPIKLHCTLYIAHAIHAYQFPYNSYGCCMDSVVRIRDRPDLYLHDCCKGVVGLYGNQAEYASHYCGLS